MANLIGTVEQLWRYPVKSMGGDRIDSAEITEAHGIPGDRAWAVRDEEAGQIRSAKQLNPLMQLRARYLAEPVGDSAPQVEITLPDGSVTRSSDSDVHERLSQALGKRVSLWPRQPADNLAHYRKSKPITERDLREMLDVDEGDELPDFSGSFTPFSEEVISQLGEFATPPGTYFDMMPLSLLTTASLRTLTGCCRWIPAPGPSPVGCLPTSRIFPSFPRTATSTRPCSSTTTPSPTPPPC